MAGHDDMPAMTASVYGTTSHSLGTGWPAVGDDTWVNTAADERTRRLQHMLVARPNIPPMTIPILTQEQQTMATKDKLRIVRVFLVDPDERVPLDQRILYKSGEITTEATDQELYFDIQVAELLRSHNKLRAGILYKEPGSKEAAEPLKEIRIRDLVMSVTTIAEFALR